METLTLEARALARQAGLNVLIGFTPSGTACTDGKTVHIDPRWVISEKPEITHILRAFLDHEVLGHVLHTQFDIGNALKTEIAKAAFGVLEDLRIEVAAQKKYPGVVKNLADGVQAICEHTEIFGRGTVEEAAMAPPISVAVNLMLIAGRRYISTLQAQTLEPRAKIWIDQAQSLFGAPVVDQVLDVCQRAAHEARSTEDVIQLTLEVEKIFKNLSKPQPKPQPQPQQGQGEQGEQSQDSSGDGSSDGSSEGSNDTSEQGASSSEKSKGKGKGKGKSQRTPQKGHAQDAQGQPQQGDAGQDQPQNEAGQNDGKSPSDDASGSPGDSTSQPSDAAQQAAKEVMNSAKGSAPTADLGEAIKQALEKRQEEMARHQAVGGFEIRQVRRSPGQIGSTAALVTKVRQGAASRLDLLLETRKEQLTSRGYTGRRLDHRALSGMSVGNARVFLRKEESEGMDTAVSILLDGSGSMRELLRDQVSRNDAAQSATDALGRLLEDAEVPWALNVFATNYVEVKEFDDPWRRARQNMAMVWGNNTNLQPSYDRALAQLSARPESRKVLVLLTDGDIPSPDLFVSSARKAQGFYGIDTAALMIGAASSTLVMSLRKAGFKATHTNHSDNLGRFVADAIENALKAA